VYFGIVHTIHPTDAPGLLLMGCFFLAFGCMTILRPREVRSFMDRFSDLLEEGSWHPYKMPYWGMRIAGLILIGISLLMLWMAQIAFKNL